ncbi:hypothetical protein SUGI_1160270 [Cryptomeria japonica]|nr:hypothetical protein SUGI_1160270 [Cryptomeria japonica]
MIRFLVEYERVVMLDADNIFLQKTDELFHCGQFCAIFINPCILHTGLFVLQPSEKVFKHMVHQLATGHGADQGFVAANFDDLLERPMFHPPTNGSKFNGFYRLPVGYQMDASFNYLALKWNIGMWTKQCHNFSECVVVELETISSSDIKSKPRN